MPNLTLEQAFEEFPDECKAVVPWGTLMIPGDWAEMTRRVILYALEWLAGKPFSPLGVLSDEAADDGSVQWLWRADPLRWLLEEVRAQLNREA